MADRKIFANQGPTKPDVPKSTFDLSHANNGTFRFGRLYPVLCYEAPAGSSFRIKPYVGFDMHPLAFPIQTNVRCHLSFYKVPFRIIWKHYRDFVGQHAADGSVANANTQYRIPYISRADDWHNVGSLADYFGIPSQAIKVDNVTSNAERSCVFDFGNVNVDNGLPASDVPYGSLYNVIKSDTRNLSVHQSDPRFMYSSNVQLDCDFAFFIYNILNFTGTTISFTLYSTNNNLATSDFVTSSGNGNNRMAIRPYFCENVGNGRYFKVSPYFPLQQILTTSNLSVTSEAVSTHYTKYTFTITLTTDIVNFLKANRNAAICVAYRNKSGHLPTSVEDSYIKSQSVEAVTIESVKEESEIIYNDLVSQANNFGWTSQYTRVYTVGNDSEFMFRTNSKGVNDGKPFIPISALPFRAYEFIFRYYFNNERITPFEKGGHPVFNEFITNDGDGADSTTPVDFFHVPYEYDLFTTCVKTPQFGNAPLVGITTNDESATFLMQNVSVTGDDAGNYAIETDTRNGRIVAITNYDEVADKPSVQRLQEAINFGISINDFRNVNALQRFQERMMKAGTKYQNIVYEFFGSNPPIGEEFPEYIGGNTSMINVSKVTSTADTGVKGLGGYVGQGSFASKGGTIRCFCAEQSYIIGLMYFTCTPVYSQMLPRHFSKSELLDFYNPQFANIGLQPVYAHQLAPLQLKVGLNGDPNEVGEVFGYNRPFSEYVSMQDEVHGDFRTSMANYLLQRVFASKPQLSSDFLYIRSGDLTNVFLDMDDSDKIFGQIYFDMKAKLPIPRFAVPRII